MSEQLDRVSFLDLLSLMNWVREHLTASQWDEIATQLETCDDFVRSKLLAMDAAQRKGRLDLPIAPVEIP